MSKKIRFPFRLVRRTEGAAAVEFAIVLNILLVLLVGMIDFGHAWFMRQIVTNASREGARLGVVYQAPAITTPQIETRVRDYLKSAGLNDPSTTVQVTGAGGASGNQLTVKVNTIKTWWIINKFIPGLGEKIQVSAQTSMRLE